MDAKNAPQGVIIASEFTVITVEQPQQTGGDGADTAAAFRRTLEQGLAGGHRAREAIVAAMLAGRVFEIDQRLDVGGLFDLRALVVTARVTREHRRAIDDAYLMGIGEHRQNAPDMRERD